MAETYQFRPFTVADLPLMAAWLARPHMTEWWGDPIAQIAQVRGDLDHPDMDQYLVLAGEVPFAYLQCYALPLSYGCFDPQPVGTRGIDQSIGEPDMLGRGHGSAFVRQFADELLAAGTPRVVTDPAPANARAIRAYEKAGFRRDRVVATPDGPALLMVRDP
ncbi:GNAT family N-acetyltransferase [Rhodoplanes sp. TEM]|uniref:GNAT family N-acetyltransferase n=1 Tax=Rhodoplanes tepidamans TaxID=200616 RepID=A0ABT5J537_RHOTP|nr:MULTISPECIES: GNAT family N-acetyltransferase [Rhodoplanes]MDC7784175.1 GNAT family N-acetyltransferase [Rhodoplanes tepidamans]MDC7983270.1 GNAT family N-acetyltransferase [Rhodoplanes sp. TEM]MDQ0356727.1 aminoglycoside 6'-N-acetyltransferase [Rhodoplanes tepidamans]